MTESSIPEIYNIFQASNGVSIDTRKIQKGNLFVAIKGENFDGNTFAIQALEQGASYALVDDESLIKSQPSDRLIYTKDSLKTLQKLASHYRKTWNFPVLAIAGSNGKTTTKELIAAVLGQRYKVFYTPGNFNNHIGLPLSILSVEEDCEFAVLELGANHLRENAFLCEICQPDFGLVTNNGKDHLEGFGSLENVVLSNKELFDAIAANDGWAFVNSDLSDLMKTSEGAKRFTYGFNNKADFSGYKLSEGYFAGIKLADQTKIKSQLIGDYNQVNLLAAFAIGTYFDVNENEIKSALERYTPKLNRSQLVSFRGATVFMDAYNANPSSMHLAVDDFLKKASSPKMLILGAMLELGSFEILEHKLLVEKIKEHSIEKIILIGEPFVDFAAVNIEWYPKTEDFLPIWNSLNLEGYSILMKGSRKFKLEQLTAV